jgi:hypothetical protein
MWNFVDDYGRAEYSPVRLKMQVLPADSADISELLGEIRRERLITIYVVDGKEYFEVCGFTKHQKVDHRSPAKIPPPSSAPPISAEPSRKSAKDQGEEGIKEEKENPPIGGQKKANGSVEKPKSRKTRLPDDWRPSERNIADARAEGLSELDIRREAAKFRDRQLATGETYIDWDATWRNWCRRVPQFNRGPPDGSLPLGASRDRSF